MKKDVYSLELYDKAKVFPDRDAYYIVVAIEKVSMVSLWEANKTIDYVIITCTDKYGYRYKKRFDEKAIIEVAEV